MTIDRYTKAVLTVIAGCLLWMCAMGTGRAVSAQPSTADLSTFKSGIQPVVIVGTGSMDQAGNIALNLVQGGGPRRTDPTLAVSLPYTPSSNANRCSEPVCRSCLTNPSNRNHDGLPVAA